jgi:hypothetical protein
METEVEGMGSAYDKLSEKGQEAFRNLKQAVENYDQEGKDNTTTLENIKKAYE